MIRLLIRLLLLSLVLPGLSSIAEQSTNDELIQNLAASRAVLEQLEDTVGSADVQLIEPLEQLAGVLIDLNLYVEADNLLDRAIQLTRMSGGLYASEQLPLQVKKIDNLINQKNWLDVRDDLEHLEWLYISKSERIDTQLIFNLRHLSDLHTRGVAEDLISRQSYHFRKSVGLNRVALSMARAAWGEHDVRLSPIIYRLVKTYHIQAVALDLGGRTGYELRAIVPGSNWVR